MDQGSTGLEMVLAAPKGKPTTYGPQRSREDSRKKDGKGQGNHPQVEVNPFWSQTIKDEVMLRAMRPACLPSASTTVAAPSTMGEEEVGVDLRDVAKMVMSQNSMLKKELADLRKRVEGKRGPRKNFGGTWIMMDSEGTHVIYNEHGAAGETRPPITPEDKGQPASSSGNPTRIETEAGNEGAEVEKKVTPGGRSEALHFISPVGGGVTLGRWALRHEEVWDFLMDESFQPGFFTPALRRKVGTPPKRTAAKDTWLTVEDLPSGGRSRSGSTSRSGRSSTISSLGCEGVVTVEVDDCMVHPEGRKGDPGR